MATFPELYPNIVNGEYVNVRLSDGPIRYLGNLFINSRGKALHLPLTLAMADTWVLEQPAPVLDRQAIREALQELLTRDDSTKTKQAVKWLRDRLALTSP